MNRMGAQQRYDESRGGVTGFGGGGGYDNENDMYLGSEE
jgi:hypothetical protein